MMGKDTDISSVILDLSGSRSDCIPTEKRKNLIGDVSESLKESADDRDILLATLAGKCTVPSCW